MSRNKKVILNYVAFISSNVDVIWLFEGVYVEYLFLLLGLFNGKGKL